MKKTQPETFTLDRIASPVGEVLLVTDAEGAVRAFDFADYEARMRKLLARHYGEVVLTEGRAPRGGAGRHRGLLRRRRHGAGRPRR